MPVRVYTSTPIHAAQADGPTPKTAGDDSKATYDSIAPGQTAAPTTTPAVSSSPPPAQPASRPSLPVQTAVPQSQASRRANYQPTQTQQRPDLPGTNSSTHTSTGTRTSDSPPAPQPATAPLPPGGQPHLHSHPHPHPHPPPPPPKAGTAPSQYMYPRPVGSGGGSSGGGGANIAGESRNYSHPPGYQQNVHAAEFSSAQLAAHNRSVLHADSGIGDDEDSIWGTAKRWAAAAGESIVAVEEQIWKKVNGD